MIYPLEEKALGKEGFVEQAKKDHEEVRAMLQQCKAMFQSGQTGPAFGVTVNTMLKVRSQLEIRVQMMISSNLASYL